VYTLCVVTDGGNHSVDRYCLAGLVTNLQQHARCRRRNFRIDLVGRDLEERLVAIHMVAHLLDPPDDRAFGNRLAHLGHYHIAHRCLSLSAC
jgi:hypothetical protein